MADPLVARRGGLVLALTWLAAFTVLQWSVVRFRVAIVLTLTAAAVALAVWVATDRPTPRWRWSAPIVLAGSLLALWLVPLFSYLDGGWLIAARVILTLGGVGCLVLLVRGGATAGRWAFGVALTTQVAVSAVAIVGDRAPRIDVWVLLQQGSDALGRGENIYAAVWTGSPGIDDAFTYLPWTAVLLAPGRWLAGDVRWALLLWSLVLLVGVWALAAGRGRAERAAAVAAVLVLAPGSLTQVDQAWTEPLLAAGIVWWAVLVRRGHPWYAVLPLALACASKQHLVLLLPVLAVWSPFGWRRTLATGALAGGLVLPWFLVGPNDFLHDTVELLLTFHPIRFANTWYLMFLNEWDITLPFWATGIVIALTLGLVGVHVHRRQPSMAAVLRGLALVLLVANLVNKQAFYNQFWLCAALVALSVALPDDAEVARPDDTEADRSHDGGADLPVRASVSSTPRTAAGPATTG